MRVEYAGQMRLGIEVDAERARATLRDPGKKIERGRCLADTTFLVEDRDDRHRESLQDALTHHRDRDFGNYHDREDREQNQGDALPRQRGRARGVERLDWPAVLLLERLAEELATGWSGTRMP
jgi:hypothetical protein